jgi:thiol-disulfide isomerase/thioredoxin
MDWNSSNRRPRSSWSGQKYLESTQNERIDSGHLETLPVSHARQAFRRRWYSQILLPILLMLLVASGCTSRSGRGQQGAAVSAGNTSYAELPQGIGRGFPLVQVAENRGRAATLSAGTAAPEFALVLSDGNTLDLSDLRGRPVMLNFWATWCPPCRAEMPDIVHQADQDEDLVVIAVNVQEDLDSVRAFAEEFGMRMPVARDTEGRLRDLFQVRGMPTSIFIDRDGDISSIWAGLLNAERLELELDRIR